jgi:hypothetical protein
MTKSVWMENWEADCSECCPCVRNVEPDGMRLSCLAATHYYDVDIDAASEEAKARMRLAAAAPALLRELLKVEWSCGHHDDSCPRCWFEIDAGREIHAPGCSLDAALTAAGLETQEQRDEARRMIAEAK